MAKQVLRMRFWIYGVLAVIGVIAGAHWWFHGRFIKSTENAYVRADMSLLTPRVGGEVIELAVHDNQAVKKGDLLLKIDPADYRAKLDSARATVAMREAELAANSQQQASQQAQIEEARAAVSAAMVERDRLDKDLDRAKKLVAEGVATRARLDTASAGALSAEAQRARAVAALGAQQQMLGMMGTNKAQLEAAVAAAKAAQVVAEIDLAATEIRAPIDGAVGDLAAHAGERVEAGRRLLSIVPLDHVYVEANFKETQLGAMAPGQQAELSADAFPGHAIKGHVDSFSPASGAEFSLLPPDNATGNFNKIVQRVPVRIAIDDPAGLAGRLRPGMSVEVDVDVRTTPSVTSPREPREARAGVQEPGETGPSPLGPALLESTVARP